jgi:glycogen operon protein
MGQAISFVLPALAKNQVWVRVMDTGAAAPMDLCLPGQGVRVSRESALRVRDHSLVMLVADYS